MSFKQVCKNLFFKCKVDRLLNYYNRTPRILFWHSIDIKSHGDADAEVIDVDVFKKQIEYLNRYYEIISIEEFEKRLSSNSFTNKEIVLTFDDGYRNNLTIVAPILNKLGLPFTVFISSQHIETGELYPTSVARLVLNGSNLKRITLPSQNKEFDLSTNELRQQASKELNAMLKVLTVEEVQHIVQDLISNLDAPTWNRLKEIYSSVKPMSIQEVVELSKTGATIGSHCKYHICCHSNQDVIELKRQIEESKQIIENWIGKPCNYFAYPNGDYTEQSNEFVAQCYNLGFSTKGTQQISQTNHKAIIPRFSVPGNMDTFKILLNLNPRK